MAYVLIVELITCGCVHSSQAREAELADSLASAQSSLQAMQKLHTAAQNQLFELQARSEEAAVGKQVCVCVCVCLWGGRDGCVCNHAWLLLLNCP